jgi:hypothetical protein
MQTGNKDKFLSTDFGMREFNVRGEKERIRRYRKYMYEAGSINRPDKGKVRVIDPRMLKKREKRTLQSPRPAGYDIARAISPIPVSSDPRILSHLIISGLNIYFTQETKKSPNPSRVFRGFIP